MNPYSRYSNHCVITRSVLVKSLEQFGILIEPLAIVESTC